MWIRATAVVLVAPLALAACGEDKEPRVRVPDPGPTCRTEGTVEAKPAGSLRDAVAPYLEDGQSLRIAEKVSGTATVQLGKGDAVSTEVTLVRTRQGWVVTSVVRC